MKKIFLLLMLFVGVTTFAQERGERRSDMSSEEMAKLRADRLGMQLDLNAEQIAKLQAYYAKEIEDQRENASERRKETKEAREKLSEERAEMMEDRKEKMAEQDKKLKEILTPEQFIKYQALQEKRMKGRKDGMRRNK
ncbi:hypothetical protein [Gramella sp. AN32]|uniref:DUF4890 domain-containing protein n=1 Tax=Christiangramia antarctica TaxID=2058158 RepID=A0ABW5X3S0_9FLAO|nr:hypothetical protein [Gramella sp. AN32]MCM4156611.1 hypothetical protein [Gramella sp. AN32]